MDVDEKIKGIACTLCRIYSAFDPDSRPITSVTMPMGAGKNSIEPAVTFGQPQWTVHIRAAESLLEDLEKSGFRLVRKSGRARFGWSTEEKTDAETE